jgi:hypothetical protein
MRNRTFSFNPSNATKDLQTVQGLMADFATVHLGFQLGFSLLHIA